MTNTIRTSLCINGRERIYEEGEKIPKNHKYPTNPALESKEKTIIISKIRFLNFLTKLNSILNEKLKIAREEKKIRLVCSYPEFDFTKMQFDEILQEIKEIGEDRIGDLLKYINIKEIQDFEDSFQEAFKFLYKDSSGNKKYQEIKKLFFESLENKKLASNQEEISFLVSKILQKSEFKKSS